jgi:ribosomal protein S18 acetylase RimI-like enzyme
MNTITIRRATQTDLPTLLEFEQNIITVELPMDPTLRRDTYHYYDLAEMLEDDESAIFIAEANGKAVGSGNVGIRQAKQYNNINEYAYAGLMYVDPEYRGKNIVSLLMDAIKQWAVEKGQTELRLQVYDANIPAVKAYEKYGFSKNLVDMRMSIE